MAEKFIVEWGKEQVITPATLQCDALSVTTGTGQAETNFPASVIFDRAQVELQGPDAPLYGVWAGAVRLPLNLPTNPPSVWFKTDVRISTDMDEGSRALIVLAVEGETFVREVTVGGRPREVSAREGEMGPEITHRDETLEFVHKGLAVPARHYTAGILLTAERPGRSGAVRFSVDSIDITVNPDLQSQP